LESEVTDHKILEDEKGLEADAFNHNWVGKASYWIFHLRKPLLILFSLMTIVLAYSALHLKVSAGFSKMIPLKHEYMQTFQRYQNDFGGANKILVSVKARQGDIYNKPLMDALHKVTEEVFYINGVERSSVTSLFTSNVRYTEVVEDGFRGGNIVSSDYAGTPEQLTHIRENVGKSDWGGRIVATDGSAAMVVATLQENDPETGKRLDLQGVAHKLEALRLTNENEQVSIEIIGFAKAIGDIADGAGGVMGYFAVAFMITAMLLFWYSGSGMLACYALICAIVPVVWLLGLLPLFGLTLDPMSILVPFLIFAIAVSHAVQMTSAWKQETLRGSDGVTASRIAFQNLFVPGAIALLANAIGFLVIAFVQIEMVQELTLTATLGVTVMIITNKMLLPILLSYRRISPEQALRMQGHEGSADKLWVKVGALATRRTGSYAIGVALLALMVGIYFARDLKIGDMGDGVPELRADSRYNQDVRDITSHYAIGVDVLQVIAEAKGDESPCVDRAVMDKMEEFELGLRQNEGVAAVRGLAGFVKMVTQSYAETNIMWRTLPEDKAQIAQGVGFATRLGNELMNSTCTAMPVSVFTRDHQATTIDSIVQQIKAFKAKYDTEQLSFRLASGNVGVMAATNESIEAADKWVNLALFASVGLLCLLMLRSVRATLCIILPLALVTVLCNAMMAWLGIGVKVNTLPVVALGVGVGVDYGIYLFESMKHAMAGGTLTVRGAFVEALKQRGTASVFTAVTMTVSVATWAFSALKFQADMGILLAFMFLANVFGAILLLPALAAFLLPNNK
jgi:predicted RND superfamily exporter protein